MNLNLFNKYITINLTTIYLRFMIALQLLQDVTMFFLSIVEL